MENSKLVEDYRISVIIPTIGRESLNRAIESVLNQTIGVYEIIVVNDLSHPNYKPIDVDMKCLVVDSIRGGVAACRNTGLAISSGNLIAFLDDDDFWVDNKIELQLNFLRDMNLRIDEKWVLTSRVLYFKNGQRYVLPEKIFAGDRIIKSLYTLGFGRVKTAFYTPTWIFPSKFCNTKFDEHLTNREDIRFLLDLEADSFKVYQMAIPLVTIEKSIDRQILREKSRDVLNWITYLYSLDRLSSIKFALGLGTKILVVKTLFMLNLLIKAKTRNTKC
jgi:glycosyltransferase involved in cell wall biosynthesis